MAPQPLSPSQLRAARALVDWTRAELAEHSGIGEQTIHRFENNVGEPEIRTQKKIRDVLEGMGIEFLPNDGVARRREDIVVLKGSGLDVLPRLHDDVYETVKDNGGTICVSGVDEKMFVKYQKTSSNGQALHPMRMAALKDKLKNKLSMQVILREGDDFVPYTTYIDYRWMPAAQFESVPFYLYEHKLAIIKNSADGLEIFIISSPPIASAFRKQFTFMWERCKIIPLKKVR